ncbi:PIGV [Hepatospora eriocheir]|uniref:GPI mannosyltransferase 2 n=1 Tax=Hepatospora eriocheir TaxID=1081669 RepID=A0A1X0QK08_9MICR|nr:PIGV [Hepatospora eriocheir]
MFKTLLLAIFSRILIIIISLSVKYISPPYDYCIKDNYSLLRWDAIHFLDIINYKYSTEHSTVFFPLLPFMIRYTYNIINPNMEIFTYSILFNNIVFILSVLLFSKMIKKIIKDKVLQNVSIVLFIFSPSSVIFSSLYSESLFVLIFLIGINQLLSKMYIKSSITFSLLGICRSNGILVILLIPFKNFYQYILSLSIILFPLSIYQLYVLYLLTKEYCWFNLRIPYSYIQWKYWDQGFLNFFKSENLFDLIVGLPIILLSLRIFFIGKGNYINNNSLYYRMLLLFVINIFMTIFFLHWNMVMRFISYNPVVYIKISEYYLRNKKIMKVYLTYLLVYLLLFSNYFPPA